MTMMTPRLLDAIVIISSTWLLILASIAIRQTELASEQLRLEEKLKKEKMEVELKFLKSQIKPHFLFNALNSIYVLAKKKSELTADNILKLSDLLDFMLYRSGEEVIEIDKEVSFIKDYIDLEKLRSGSKLELIFEDKLVNRHHLIEPMTISTLVENAFKHGLKHERGKAKIHIQISDKDGLQVLVKNSKPDYKGTDRGGIGLKNLIQRLNRRYGDKYELFLSDEEKHYTAILKIELND